MPDLKPVLHWTLAEVAGIRQRLRATPSIRLGQRVAAHEQALLHLGAVVEELARHLDLIEAESAPWLEPGTDQALELAELASHAAADNVAVHPVAHVRIGILERQVRDLRARLQNLETARL